MIVRNWLVSGREVKRLKAERNILKKETAFFVNEQP